MLKIQCVYQIWLLTLYLMKSNSPKSEYQIALETLLKTFATFQKRFTDYVDRYHYESKQMQSIATLWNDPNGISNFIKCLSLQRKLFMKQTSPIKQANFKQYNQDQYVEKMEEIEAKGDSYDNQEMEKQQYLNDAFDSNNVKEQEPEDDEDQNFEMIQNNDEDYKSQKDGQRSYKRGPYKSYTIQEKEKAVRMLSRNQYTISEISRMLKIPCKNIKRWSVEGVNRKRGGHRRSCPQMQKTVYSWIKFHFQTGAQISMAEVQNYALQVCNDPFFKASRGWLLKFMERYNLKDSYVFK